MKKMLFSFIVLLFITFAGTKVISNNTVYAAANRLFSPTIPPSFTLLEYFIDTDPGFGNGYQVTAIANDELDMNFNIPLSNVITGFHSLYIRVKDNQGKWSFTHSMPFYKMPASIATTTPNITQLEYFLDTDPGFGNGMQVSTTLTDDATKDFNVPLQDVTSGFHTIYVRAKDDKGKWSFTHTMPFYKMPASIVTTTANITQLEYFVDTDPGFGSATAVTTTLGDDATKDFNVPLQDVTSGFHTIYVRAKDDKGKWSFTHTMPFYKMPSAIVVQTNVTKLEYFVDTDPGFGNGIAISTDENGDIAKDFIIDLSGFTNGSHTLYIRAMDNKSRWSLTQTTNFKVNSLGVKVFLEGLYAGNGLMNQAKGISGSQFDTGIADSVRVELHKADAPDEVSNYYDNRLLQNDGTINIKTVAAEQASNYYLVVKNRNSVETWSSSPITISGDTPAYYDFSTSASQAYGNNMKLMPDNVYAIYAGDPNQDGIVDGSDMAAIDNSSTAVLVGYNPEDLNGDGLVDASDMAIIDNNSTAVVHVVRP